MKRFLLFLAREAILARGGRDEFLKELFQIRAEKKITIRMLDAMIRAVNRACCPLESHKRFEDLLNRKK